MLALIGEALIALAHAVVGDQCLDVESRQLLQVILAVVTRVRRHDRGILDQVAHGLDHRNQ